MTDHVDVSVLVLLGTDHHPFDRLLRWVERWLDSDATRSANVLVQHGFTVPPRVGDRRAKYVSFLDHHVVDEQLGRATAVVCHGGPGTIADCRRAGLLPVVLPRSSALGEHVDDHQVLYTRRLHRDGLIRIVDGEADFAVELEAALARPRARLTDLDDSVVAATVASFSDVVAAAGSRGRRVGLRSGWRRVLRDG